jgi:hypothetical protein
MYAVVSLGHIAQRVQPCIDDDINDIEVALHNNTSCPSSI